MSASPHLGTQTSAQSRALFIDADPEIRAMPVNILEAGRNIHKCAVENLASGDRGLRLQPVVNFLSSAQRFLNVFADVLGADEVYKSRLLDEP